MFQTIRVVLPGPHSLGTALALMSDARAALEDLTEEVAAGLQGLSSQQ